MAYRITYEKQTMKKQLLGEKNRCLNIKWVCAVLLLVVMFSMLFNAKARRHLLPGNPEITERALNNMLFNIQDGKQVVDAVKEFCQEILDNA